jgi:hypothetical protein
VSLRQVKKLLAKMSHDRARALERAEFVAGLKESCGELIDPEILAGGALSLRSESYMYNYDT